MIRYLHGRCLRLESCRKALVWQKRYLQRVLAGYTELEKNLRLPSSGVPEVSRGKKRFKCIATVVVIVLRMGFLVRRRQHVRALSANCLLRPARDLTLTRNTPSQHSPPVATPPPPPRVGPAPPAASLARRALQQDMPFNLSASPSVGDFIRRSPYTANSPHEDPFVLNSAGACVPRLELVRRCLARALEARHVP
ncbi:unnamed protein product [Arctia plantaginis]|uniref:Pericentrin/AKAP-450 centrosomal targeting domain-containing protein n=1 Tax=Arctia plantaginis TaxID=874455 RepID=A0A8S0ZRJ2_ARCPL|nr:unnamed protein product [Arctia plantaginis]